MRLSKPSGSINAALNKSGNKIYPLAFRRFKDVLLDYEIERQNWFDFSGNRALTRVAKWLESNGLTPEREVLSID